MVRERKTKPKRYSIGIVADLYGIHEQTLRLYEREGLLVPSRSERNTRYYTDEDLEKLQLILNLTREMGVNLAGVQIIIDLRKKMDEMQREFNRFLEYIREQMPPDVIDRDHFRGALVRVSRPMSLVHVERPTVEAEVISAGNVRRIPIEIERKK